MPLSSAAEARNPRPGSGFRTYGVAVGQLDWLLDRSDPRVVAALAHTCSVCNAPPGDDCGWRDPRHHARLALVGGAVIHHIRVPQTVSFGDHLLVAHRAALFEEE
ncbi:hypothetical protein I553_10709 [Mycobacterium xenopi 4042]|uniref:DNA-binding phage zinc finger domain-containing protein n=1 Tax=Mycobacterium xenopi 4042 TaxID=1299334 RepID=X8D9W8_MYCXE|nr:hypothetical protein I553_10709 [Mycobacterium xenopi 4042]